MAECVRCQCSAARGALHEATLDKEGFDNVLDPIAWLGLASMVAAIGTVRQSIAHTVARIPGVLIAP